MPMFTGMVMIMRKGVSRPPPLGGKPVGAKSRPRALASSPAAAKRARLGREKRETCASFGYIPHPSLAPCSPAD